MRKKVYIAYTGGTIGMAPSPHGYKPKPGFLSQTLLDMPEFHRCEMPLYTLHEYAQLMDSSDMSPDDWMTIASDIQSVYADYDAFIILHGTDTMAYTASALSFIFANLSKPVIVTGSQIPLAELRSDGQINLLNSLYIAANYPIPEVSLFFNNKLLRGNRSKKTFADGFSAFESPNFSPLLESGINIELVAGRVNTSPPSQSLKIHPVSSQPIGVIPLYPGINEKVIENTIQQPVKALILLTYGVGNGPQNSQLLSILKRAKQNSIVLINCTQCLRGKVNMRGYASGNNLYEIGFVSARDMTLEACLTKLHYLLSQSLTPNEIERQFSLNLRGEITLITDN